MRFVSAAGKRSVSDGLRRAAATLAQTRGFSLADRQNLLDLLDPRRGDDAQVGGPGAAVLAELGRRDFDWPEFDQWQAYFRASQASPPLWDGLVDRPPSADTAVLRVYRERKLLLLLDWLRALAGRAETRTVLARYERLGVAARVVRQDVGAACPTCDRLHGSLVQDAAALPPFHPGCRCLVLPAVTGSRAGHGAGG